MPSTRGTSNHIGQISYDFPLVVSPNITFLNGHPVINLSTGLLASLLPYPPHPMTAKAPNPFQSVGVQMVGSAFLGTNPDPDVAT